MSPGPAGHQVATALARLQASREQLRHELLPPPKPEARPPGPLPRQLHAAWRWVRRRFGHSPVLGVAVQSVQQWWQSHPWRGTSELLAGELHAGIAPVIRRHPLAAVGAATAVGVALMVWKPWRWSPVRRQLAPLPGHVGRLLLRQLMQPSVQVMLAGLVMSAGLGKAARRTVDDDAPDARAEAHAMTTPPWPDLPAGGDDSFAPTVARSAVPEPAADR